MIDLNKVNTAFINGLKTISTAGGYSNDFAAIVEQFDNDALDVTDRKCLVLTESATHVKSDGHNWHVSVLIYLKDQAQSSTMSNLYAMVKDVMNYLSTQHASLKTACECTEIEPEEISALPVYEGARLAGTVMLAVNVNFEQERWDD